MRAENAIKQWDIKLIHSTAMERFYIPTRGCFAPVSARNRFYNTCTGFSTKKIAFLSIAAVYARNRIFCEIIRLCGVHISIPSRKKRKRKLPIRSIKLRHGQFRKEPNAPNNDSCMYVCSYLNINTALFSMVYYFNLK